MCNNNNVIMVEISVIEGLLVTGMAAWTTTQAIGVVIDRNVLFSLLASYTVFCNQKFWSSSCAF